MLDRVVQTSAGIADSPQEITINYIIKRIFYATKVLIIFDLKGGEDKNDENELKENLFK